MTNFKNTILKELEDLFPDGELETLVRGASDVQKMDMAVKIIHTKTNTEQICDEFDTQVENKSLALIKLYKKIM